MCQTEKRESDTDEKCREIYSNFMGRVAKFDELVSIGSRLLSGFQQGLDYIRRPQFEKTSKLFDEVIGSNETKRLSSYIQARGLTVHDVTGSMSKSKDIVDELEVFVNETASRLQTATDSLYHLQLKDSDSDNIILQEDSLSSNHKRDSTYYGTLMAIIYSMVKQDYIMQEKIVSSLGLRSSSEELQSYCLMWSLRPFIEEEVMRTAWEVFP